MYSTLQFAKESFAIQVRWSAGVQTKGVVAAPRQTGSRLVESILCWRSTVHSQEQNRFGGSGHTVRTEEWVHVLCWFSVPELSSQSYSAKIYSWFLDFSSFIGTEEPLLLSVVAIAKTIGSWEVLQPVHPCCSLINPSRRFACGTYDKSEQWFSSCVPQCSSAASLQQASQAFHREKTSSGGQTTLEESLPPLRASSAQTAGDSTRQALCHRRWCWTGSRPACNGECAWKRASGA